MSPMRTHPAPANDLPALDVDDDRVPRPLAIPCTEITLSCGDTSNSRLHKRKHWGRPYGSSGVRHTGLTDLPQFRSQIRH